jgi:CIC family chloride channel protein
MAMEGRMAFEIMFILAFAKILATSFTVGSGGSGGVFAPSLFIGAMLGGAFGHLSHMVFPSLVAQPGAFVLVGMGGFFAGVAKVPIAALIIVAEMTGGYSLILPLMLVSAIAYIFLGKTSLYEKQVGKRVDSPAHLGDFVIDILESVSVKESLPKGRKVDVIPEGMYFKDILKIVDSSRNSYFPVVDSRGKMAGILSLSDLRGVFFEDELSRLVIAKDIASVDVICVTMDDNLSEALKKLTSKDIGQLPVVDRNDPKKVLALLSRKDIITAYHNALEQHRGKTTDTESTDE